MKLHILLLFVLNSVSLFSMENSSLTNAPIIGAVEKKKNIKVMSLKKLAALKLVASCDPSDDTVNVDILRKYKQAGLPVELQEYLRSQLIKEKADTFEEINNAQTMQLSEHEIANYLQVSPDSEYLAYITFKRKLNGTADFNNCSLVIIHLPTKKEYVIKHDELAYQKESWHIKYAPLFFSYGSKYLLFESVASPGARSIWQYDLTKQTLEKMQNYVPTTTIQKKNFAYLAGSPFDAAEIFNSSEKIAIKCSWCKNVINIWDVLNKQLLKKIKFNNQIGSIAFVDDNHFVISIQHGISPLYYNRLFSDLCGNYKILTSEGYNTFNELSSDARLFVGRQNVLTDQCNDAQLFDCVKQKTLKKFTNDHYEYDSFKLISDGAVIVSEGMRRTKIDSQHGRYMIQTYPFKCATFRAITNDAVFSELVGLLIAEKQKKNKQTIDPAIIKELQNSKNLRLAEIVKERYLPKD